MLLKSLIRAKVYFECGVGEVSSLFTWDGVRWGIERVASSNRCFIHCFMFRLTFVN